MGRSTKKKEFGVVQCDKGITAGDTKCVDV